MRVVFNSLYLSSVVYKLNYKIITSSSLLFSILSCLSCFPMVSLCALGLFISSMLMLLCCLALRHLPWLQKKTSIIFNWKFILCLLHQCRRKLPALFWFYFSSFGNLVWVSVGALLYNVELNVCIHSVVLFLISLTILVLWHFIF